MVTIPKRVKIEIFEMGGKIQAESKYVRSSYCDTEEQAIKEHNEKLKIFRRMLKKNS